MLHKVEYMYRVECRVDRVWVCVLDSPFIIYVIIIIDWNE